MTSSLRFPFPKVTASAPRPRANRSGPSVKRRAMGAIRAGEGTGLPRTSRKNQAAPAPVRGRGTQASGQSLSKHSGPSVT